MVTVAADGLPETFGSPLTTPLAIVVPLCFALVHGARRFNVAGILAFLVLCLGISNVMETLSVVTGFPVGHYHYTDALGPKLFLVQLLIGPAYEGFALYRTFRPEPPIPTPPRSHWFQACIFFAVMAMELPAGYLGGQIVAVTDVTGKVWQTGGILETSAIVILFTMVTSTVASFAVLLLRREPQASPSVSPLIVRTTVM